ncbi:MAG: hypothetical protein QOH71_3245 [Blastocatellia bacterium]|jgi:dipeptide/tripeptide permease|nr:hypothetical protein [Blastocatellia bacterium]
MPKTNATGVSRHPKALYVLFATEMWERFSCYTMIAMFALYMRDTTGQCLLVMAFTLLGRLRPLKKAMPGV